MAELVAVRELVKHYPGQGILARARGGVRAVDRVSFSIPRGSTFGLVGESGCGKTTLARSLLYLDPPTSGTVLLNGTELGSLPPRELRASRKRMQIVFQDPNGALDPKMRVRASVAEGMVNFGVPAGQRGRRVGELLALVGINPDHADRYPHEFSGGQKQRIVVARALSLEPELLVLDEPVSNLDVSIQAQIINLLLELKSRLDLTYLFISHDLNLVGYLSDRIGVMYRGRLVELGDTDEILRNPVHPYTQALFAAVPGISGEGIARRVVHVQDVAAAPAAGAAPAAAGGPAAPPPPAGGPGAPARTASGCAYAERCSRAEPACLQAEPELVDIGGGHLVACIRASESTRQSSA
ncbi:MAG: ABC transporter ATP-binding protein [Spirochaetales bacterium]|nr:ABC transporter ATP-binding protein [Spirochaetales bacterium]